MEGAPGSQVEVVWWRQHPQPASSPEGREREVASARSKEWLKLNVGGKVGKESSGTVANLLLPRCSRLAGPPSPPTPAALWPRCSSPSPNCVQPSWTVEVLYHLYTVSHSLPPVYQLDACPRAFSVLLNWLRYRRLMLGPAIKAEEVWITLSIVLMGDL